MQEKGKKIWIEILAISMLFCLVACDFREEENQISKTPDESVQEMKKYRNCNDKYLYRIDSDGNIIQCCLEDHREKIYKLSERSTRVLWVEQEWIYYAYLVVDDELGLESHGVVCRNPLRRNEKGEEVLLNQREQLMETEVVPNAVLLLNDTLYVNDWHCFAKLDLKTRQITYLKGKKDAEYGSHAFYVLGDPNGNPTLYKDVCIYYWDALYQMDMETGKSKKIWEERQNTGYTDDPSGWRIYRTPDKRSIIFQVDGKSIWRYDEERDKSEIFIPQKKIQSLVESINPWKFTEKKKGKCDISSFYVNHGRLYLSVEIDWKDMYDGYEDVSYAGYIMLSCKLEDGTDLRYEKKISECLKEEAYERSVDYSGITEFGPLDAVKTGNILYLWNDILVMSTTEAGTVEEGYDDGENLEEYKIILYQLEDNTYKIVDENDWRLWQIYSGGYIGEDGS